MPSKGIYLLDDQDSQLASPMFANTEYVVDVKDVTSREVLLARFAEDWKFPEYFGHNWDAFEEIVRELPPNQLYIVEGNKSLRARIPVEAKVLEEILEDTLSKRALVLLVQS